MCNILNALHVCTQKDILQNLEKAKHISISLLWSHKHVTEGGKETNTNSSYLHVTQSKHVHTKSLACHKKVQYCSAACHHVLKLYTTVERNMSACLDMKLYIIYNGVVHHCVLHLQYTVRFLRPVFLKLS